MLEQFPDDWDDFVGQDEIKRRLQVAARAARIRGTSMPHQLLTGPAGMGKTALAVLTAREVGSQCYVNSGSIDFDGARILLSQMSDGDVWLIDEIHRLARGGAHRAEWMLHFIENGTLVGPRGMEVVPAVTVIGTTTDEGDLPAALLQRFPEGMALRPYTDEEGVAIADVMARRLLVPAGLPVCRPDTLAAMARAMRNHPRRMRKLVEQLRDLALTGEVYYDDGGEYDLEEVLQWMGVDGSGLTRIAQEYLRVLAHEMGGKPTGGKLLADRLGTSGSVFEETETLLLDLGLIVRQRTGRYLTTDGIKYTTKLKAA